MSGRKNKVNKGIYFRPSDQGPAEHKGKRGYWYISYTVKGAEEGRYRREKTDCRERYAAEIERGKRMDAAKHEIACQNGEESIRLHDLADRYMAEHVDIKCRSRKLYVVYLAKIKEHFGNVPVVTLTKADCMTFKAAMLTSARQRHFAKAPAQTEKFGELPPFSPGTANRYLAALKGMMRWAESMNLIPMNPAASVRLERETARRYYYVDSREKALLVAAAKESRSSNILPALTLALYTGMRIGEILAMTWDRVDLENGYITLEITKGGRMRHVPISAAAVEVLRGLQERPGQGKYLFPGSVEGHVKDLSNAWEEVRRKVALVVPKFKRCRFHDLRHTAGSDLVKAGVPIPVVKEILGHREISTTMRYAHVLQEQLRDAVGLIPVFHRIFTDDAVGDAEKAINQG